jgi:hypothetical protein
MYYISKALLTASPRCWRIRAFVESINKHRASGPPRTDNPQLMNYVYKFLCSCGKVYIGQINHHISMRISEHIRNIRLGEWCSAAEHFTETKCSIICYRTEVLPDIRSHLPSLYHQGNNKKTNILVTSTIKMNGIMSVFTSFCPYLPLNHQWTATELNPCRSS